MSKYEELNKEARAFLQAAIDSDKAISSILFLVAEEERIFEGLKRRIEEEDLFGNSNSEEFKQILQNYEKKGDELGSRLKELKLNINHAPSFLSKVSLITGASTSMYAPLTTQW